MTVDPGEYKKVIEAIKKSYKNKSITIGTDFPDPVRIPTGIIEIDSLIGGGIPMGRYTHIWGGYSSCKTLISLNTIANAQKMGISCVYYDLENQFQKSWAESVGVDTSEDALTVVTGSVVEEVCDVMEALLSVRNLHVIDSVGMGVTYPELNSEPSQQFMGIVAKTWTAKLRALNSSFDTKDNAVIMINQSYASMGPGGAEVPRGGAMIDFISSLSIHTKKSSWLYKDVKGNLSKEKKVSDFTNVAEPAGMEILVKLTKNKVEVPKQLGAARLRLEFQSERKFDEIWTLTRTAIFHNLVERSGSWYTLPNGEKVQGETGIRNYIEENEDFKELCRKTLQG
jgi:recombination protein RecA